MLHHLHTLRNALHDALGVFVGSIGSVAPLLGKFCLGSPHLYHVLKVLCLQLHLYLEQLNLWVIEIVSETISLSPFAPLVRQEFVRVDNGLRIINLIIAQVVGGTMLPHILIHLPALLRLLFFGSGVFL